MQSPSAIQQYNEELALAHREAIAALRELLSTEKDPAERRRLAIAILKARPIKDPATQPQPKAVRPAAQNKRHHEFPGEFRELAEILQGRTPNFEPLTSSPAPDDELAATATQGDGPDRPPSRAAA